MSDENFIDRFEKITAVRNGSISQEEYEKEEEGIIIEMHFDDIQKLYEDQLEKRLIEFSKSS
ncbi:hypothetical protein KPL26_08545 [Clostridium algidicarnis]|uniref:hypothetical protein n=1 Tax=Clostridium algidicarnis TaxID=37659 RepID=UPI001C0B71FB|nr:hypothetical protein [Clostridium algidicarnis]MBU3196722.1 hypothetical protein [Clostridium algidicarnis]